jgi:glycosyltransferase involved in cell wall biosynthesis
MKRPLPTDVDIEVRRLAPAAVVAGLGRAIARRPVACARVIATVVRRSAPRNMPSQLVATCIGLAWAGNGTVSEDHLHAHFGWVAATAAWSAATVAGKPYSVMLHAFEMHSRRHVDRFTPIPLQEATRVFTESHRDRGIIRERWGVDATVVRMGVPRAWVDPSPVERDPWLIVSVGALRAKKGHDVLLRAVALADPRWRLAICGEGPLRADLEEQIAELGLDERVTLAGAQSEAEVHDWLHRAALSCLACVETPGGDRDGIPIALMEGLAAGTAVVSTYVGAIHELLEGVGTLVPSGDAAALASALDALRDPAVRARMAAAGRRRILEEFVAEEAAAPVVDLVRHAQPTRAHVAS